MTGDLNRTPPGYYRSRIQAQEAAAQAASMVTTVDASTDIVPPDILAAAEALRGVLLAAPDWLQEGFDPGIIAV